MAAGSGVLLVLLTALPLVPSDEWWIRVWDFPRLRIAALLAAVAIAVPVLFGLKHPGALALFAGVLLALAFQVARMVPYTPLYAVQAEPLRGRSRAAGKHGSRRRPAASTPGAPAVRARRGNDLVPTCVRPGEMTTEHFTVPREHPAPRGPKARVPCVSTGWRPAVGRGVAAISALFGASPGAVFWIMHKLLFVLLFAAVSAFAQPGPVPEGRDPTLRSIGKWGDWEAFTSRDAETGATVCHALSRPFSSIPAVAGRGEPMLTVTKWPERPDAVALIPGHAGTGAATVELRVGSALFPFDAGPDGASARDGAAVVAAMERGLQAIARFAAPGGARATDTYSLRGFRAAYGAMRRACPAR